SVVGAVNIEIDLETGVSTYTVLVPTGGFAVGDSFSQTLLNFVDVNGTNNDDVILGSGEGNLFGGSAGNDVFDGRGGIDTLDYAGLGAAVTLRADGEIDKGALGTDLILGMETIIGDAGETNTIDATVTGPQSTALIVSLELGTLMVEGVPGVGTLSFDVVNFVNVIGTANADTIGGDATDNRIAGAGGSDQLEGNGGDDAFVFQGDDTGVDTVADFSDGDVLVLDGGFGAFSGTSLSFTDIVGAVGAGNEIVAGTDVISAEADADGVSVLFNDVEFAILQGDDLIA
ncbi:MAG: hypothetical protein AAFU70_00735, partial [Planctomycetota bacterium]